MQMQMQVQGSAGLLILNGIDTLIGG